MLRLSTNQNFNIALLTDLMNAAGALVADTIAAGASNQVIAFVDAMDEGASVYKVGALEVFFALHGATPATAKQVYSGVIRCTFDGSDAATVKITVEWVHAPDPSITFDAVLAANQLQLRASNAAGTDIDLLGIQRVLYDAVAHS